MSKKKKIILGIVLGIIVLAIGVKLLFGGKASDKPVAESNIEYYTVEDVEQVFINGIVTPTESKEFIKDATLGKLGDLNVKNGDNIEKDTVLYQYVDETSDNQITELKFQIESTQAEKEKAARQMQLELNELGQNKEATNNASTQESISLKYDLNSYDIKMGQLQSQIDELYNKQVNQVTAPFSGQITIAQEQNRDSAIMTLTSNDFYVEGEVNERDLSKIKVKQPAEVRTIADNKVYQGEITYISTSPTTAQTNQAGANQGGSTGALSTYTVKLTLKDGQDVRTGFHVQSSIKLDDKKIQIPEKAVHTDESNKQKYVFVDDFGTVLRKDIKVSEAAGEKGMVIVDSGLEGLDKIIVKSDKELKNGEILDNAGAEMSGEMN
ncbi:HlyD family efflux transporter periplasmic adaptor subunit [Vagococcus sp. DIV0080]|uniref:HlyD family efflux transporter periplasmic adaptor subunit n=1 Tax=Candidatus Vagococcus giribetii TaxID=2230876 RepID=A0ABS3HX05_9ENTE|nr:HlyD family efflux transporter periplasmic adaptor subunit [Vagococcus sp. DIV0080]MBO0477663.1 HlyD family efflux transporter periplasmic adaptor subunit [Vagococcus sp. DIV0080]